MSAPPISEAYRFQLQQEATFHCQQVWPAVEAYRMCRDVTVLYEPSQYLGNLKAANPLLYNIVMKMLSLRSGVDWPTIRDALV